MVNTATHFLLLPYYYNVNPGLWKPDVTDVAVRDHMEFGGEAVLKTVLVDVADRHRLVSTVISKFSRHSN
jgi:hypothetical protein